MNLLWQCLCACVVCMGFALVFNMHDLGILICGGGGAIGWLIYCTGNKTIFSAFAAAAAIALFSESVARLRRCPVTGYLMISLLPLVPGSGIYYAMRHCVLGEYDLFFSTLLSTVGMAASLALGAMLASSVFRSVFPRIAQHRNTKNSSP